MSKTNRTFLSVAVVATACLALTTAANAAVVDSYTFDTDAEGWAGRNGSTATGAVVDSGFANSPVLAITSGDPTRAYVTFTETTLATTGDYIEATFKMKLRERIQTYSRYFMVGLYDISTMDGYIGKMGWGSQNMGALYVDNNIPTSGDGAMSSGTSISSTGTIQLGDSESYIHTITMRLTKTATGIDILVSGDGRNNGTNPSWAATTISGSETANGFTTFDTLDLSENTRTVKFNIDSVVIEKVPEPATLALLGLGGLGLILGRKRK